ncbi:MAG: FkbM family methyltransferase [Opitutaceae bacterium]|nr:FkbM family methyltransferase [Opitutaceae bacterium]
MKLGSLIAAFNRLPCWQRRVSVWGFCLRAPTFDRWLYLFLHRMGRMGGDERACLSSLVRSGMQVVDIGANIGLYTLHLARLVGPAGRVDAFEPDALMAWALRENLAANGVAQVEVHQCAVGADMGQAVLQRNAINSGDNRLGLATGMALIGEQESVRVGSLDGILDGRRVDFIKMDVQGWEAEAFRGFAAVLDANPKLQIYFEFWPYGLGCAGTEVSRFADILAALRLNTYLPLTGERVDLPQLATTLRKQAFTNLLAYR